MSDVLSVKKKLATVRNKLDASDTSASSDIGQQLEKKASSQLISLLSQACQGIDSQLDARLKQLSDDLDNSASVRFQGRYHELDGLLKGHSNTLRDLLAHGHRIVKSSAESLQKVNGLPPQLRRKLSDFLDNDGASSQLETQRRIEQLLNFYHQALLNKPSVPAPRTGAILEQEAKPKERLLDNRQHKRICDELQRLITEMNYEGDVGSKLAEIRSNLLVGIEPNDLPSLCIDTIQLIIEGNREERKASQEFLFSLNESLEGVHDSVHQSVTDGKRVQNERKTSDKEIRSTLLEIGADVRQQEDLSALKSTILQRLSHIAEIFSQKEQLESQSEQLIERLQQMEQRLRVVNEEANEYKKRLSAHKHKLFIDSLTQVYNRAALDERMELEFKRWKRYGYSLAMAIIDIDHFKSINDQYGHMAGDKALKVIARSLQNSLRDTDFLARFGGEEFVLLMPNTSPDALAVPLDNLREQIKALPFRFKDQQVSITISIGATLFKDGDKPLDAFERADQALYESKNGGRDRLNVIS
ncbi:diguanylate cyclase [Aliagarivorans taiwanensis]|uniref:diguanylate cyclase n=1 Tax=Aliagarivorans taiwanensis TaxID=561966 RepID=UPI00047C3D5C